MKIKIKNDTEYETRNLRKIISRCIKTDGPRAETKMDIHIRPSKKYLSGYAYLNSNFVCMRIPSTGEIDTVRFTQIFIHELQHCRGEVHREMVKSKTIDAGWAKAFPIQKRPVKIKPVADLKSKRYETAKSRVSKYEIKMKRMATLLKKWKRKVTYYENAIGQVADKQKGDE